eukprot:5240385-Prymnesium_polylepis.1
MVRRRATWRARERERSEEEMENEEEGEEEMESESEGAERSEMDSVRSRIKHHQERSRKRAKVAPPPEHALPSLNIGCCATCCGVRGSGLDNAPAPANCRSQVATALVTLRHP